MFLHLRIDTKCLHFLESRQGFPGPRRGPGCSLVAVRLCQSNVDSLENVFPVPYSVSAAGPGQGSSSTQEIDTKRKICEFCFPRTRGPAETPQKRLLCAAQLDNSPLQRKRFWPAAAARTSRGAAASSYKLNTQQPAAPEALAPAFLAHDPLHSHPPRAALPRPLRAFHTVVRLCRVSCTAHTGAGDNPTPLHNYSTAEILTINPPERAQRSLVSLTR